MQMSHHLYAFTLACCFEMHLHFGGLFESCLCYLKYSTRIKTVLKQLGWMKKHYVYTLSHPYGDGGPQSRYYSNLTFSAIWFWFMFSVSTFICLFKRTLEQHRFGEGKALHDDDTAAPTLRPPPWPPTKTTLFRVRPARRSGGDGRWSR